MDLGDSDYQAPQESVSSGELSARDPEECRSVSPGSARHADGSTRARYEPHSDFWEPDHRARIDQNRARERSHLDSGADARTVQVHAQISTEVINPPGWTALDSGCMRRRRVSSSDVPIRSTVSGGSGSAG